MRVQHFPCQGLRSQTATRHLQEVIQTLIYLTPIYINLLVDTLNDNIGSTHIHTRIYSYIHTCTYAN